METQISISKYLVNQYLSYQTIYNGIQKIVIHESHNYKSFDFHGESPEWEAMIAVIKRIDSGIYECIYKHQNLEKTCIIRQTDLLNEIRKYKSPNIPGNSTEWKGISLFFKNTFNK